MEIVTKKAAVVDCCDATIHGMRGMAQLVIELVVLRGGIRLSFEIV